VGGTDQYVKLATRVIEELDAYPPQERICRIYRLRNVQAVEIESAMRKWLDEEHKRLTESVGTDNLGAVQRQLEREVSVVAVATSTDASGSATQPSSGYSSYGSSSTGAPSAQLHASGTTSNTLLVSASPRYFDNVIEMIQQLDEPPPQVLIDVLLAEITLDDKTDLGADWSYQTPFQGNVLNTGTDFSTAKTIQQAGSGFNLSITGGNLEFFIHALQSQGRMRVLNRPQILAIDNQASRIESGQQVPVPNYTYQNGNGTVSTSFSNQPVGIILEVIPRISPDGFVRMEVHPEISSLSATTVDLGNGTKASIINRRSATTTITVKDGHSIVVGGLISTSDQTLESKVPLLGDVPILGWLFKSASVSKQRTELLIILTPRIIRAVPEADYLTDQEAHRLKLLGGSGVEGLTETLYNPLQYGPKIRLDGVHWDQSAKPGDKQSPFFKPDRGGQVPATQPAWEQQDSRGSQFQQVKQDLKW
jgi:type II secretion system protein D